MNQAGYPVIAVVTAKRCEAVPYSAATCAPYSATARFMTNTNQTSTTDRPAKAAKVSK